MKLKERRHYQVMKEMREILLDSIKDVGVSIQNTELIKPLEEKFENDELVYTWRLLHYKGYLKNYAGGGQNYDAGETGYLTEKGFTEWLFPLGPENPRKAFISFADVNKGMAGSLRDGLKDCFDEIFLSHESIPVGYIFRDRLISELTTSGVFIALRTGEYSKANYTEQECGFALALNKRIVCIWLGTDPEKTGFCGAHQGKKFKADEDIQNIVTWCRQVFASEKCSVQN